MFTIISCFQCFYLAIKTQRKNPRMIPQTSEELQIDISTFVASLPDSFRNANARKVGRQTNTLSRSMYHC